VLALGGGFLGMFRLWRRAEAERGRAEAAQARAEAARVGAEADYRRAAELLGLLIQSNVGGREDLPRVVSPGEVVSRLQLTRRSLLELADRLPDREATYAQLRSVDTRLGRLLAEQERWDEVQRLHESSIREAEAAIRRFPRASFAKTWLLDGLSFLVQRAEKAGKPEEAEGLLARAVAIADAWSREAPGVESLVTLTSRRRELALGLAMHGRCDEARALLIANHRLLEAADRTLAPVAIERIQNALDFHHLDVGSPPDPCGAEAGQPEPLVRLASPEGDRLPAEAWAHLSLRVLEPVGTSPERTAARWFARHLQDLASAHRRAGRLDRARRIAEQLSALARLLVERNPRDAVAYFMLADAYEQQSKNAWRPVGDLPTIRRTLAHAVAANRRAVDLAPDDEVARNELERRLRKLHDLPHPGAKLAKQPIPLGAKERSAAR
jgi:tetratricopeptide (TPR) repeat protein